MIRLFAIALVFTSISNASDAIYRYCKKEAKISKLESSVRLLDYIITGPEAQYRPQINTCMQIASLPTLKADFNCSAHTIDSQTYCHKKNPTKKNEFFLEDMDLPADFVLAKPDANLFYQNPLQTGLNSLNELNDLAFDLWRRLVICSNGSSELARSKFSAKNFVCSGVANDTNLASDFKLFESNLFNVLMQASIRDTIYFDNRLNHSSLVQHEGELYAKHKSRINHNARFLYQTDVEPPHPLIVQLLLQFISKAFVDGSNSFSFSSKQSSIDTQYVNLIRNIANVLILVNSKQCSPMGLFPSKGWAVWSEIRSQLLLAREKIIRWPENKTFLDTRGVQTSIFKMYVMDYFTPNYGFTTLNCVPQNLPKIFTEESDYLIKSYANMDSTFKTLKIRQD